MGGIRGIAALVLCLGLLPPLGSGQETTPLHLARVQYELGNHFAGRADGSCESPGGFFPKGNAGRIQVETTGGEWLRHERHYNVTHVSIPTSDPFPITYSDDVKEFREPLPAGRVEIAWTSSGRADVYAAPGPLFGQKHTVTAQFQGAEFAAGRVMEQILSVTWYYESEDWGTFIVISSLVGPNRHVQMKADRLVLEGDLVFYLENATLTDASGTSLHVDQREQLLKRTEMPDGSSLEYRLTNYAFVTLQGARLEMPVTDFDLVCQNLQANLTGQLDLYLARGVVERSSQRRDFERQELTLQGAFAWNETSQQESVQAEAVGGFDAVGLDFADAFAQESGLSIGARASLLATFLALLGSLAWWLSKSPFPFFSRLTEQQVAEHPTRRRILEEVRSTPNIILRSLTAHVGVTQSEVRYHARILESRGLLRSHRVGRDRCYVARETLNEQGRHLLTPTVDVIVRNDPIVAAILRTVPAQGLRLNPLLLALASELGISRPGAWKAVLRAERYGLIQRNRVGNEVWVRCA